MAAAQLAILNQLEYRTNFLIDVMVQPLISSAFEVTLWSAMLAGMGTSSLGGFGREFYLSYALWSTFVGRITTNWMYEFIMLNDIDSGSVNAILMRPLSFYEYYLSQFIGYKGLAAVVSLCFPLIICLVLGLPFEPWRLPLFAIGILYYLVFAHTMSFCVACLAFFLNRAQSFTGIKNLAIMILAGELIPLDLYPEPFRSWLLRLPFSAGVYLPTSYITGRVDQAQYVQGFLHISVGIAVVAILGAWLWRQGLRRYAGTGA